jgi:hypothetical protein
LYFFFYFLQIIPISKGKVYLFFFEKVIGKIGISYFTYRKMQPSSRKTAGTNGRPNRPLYKIGIRDRVKLSQRMNGHEFQSWIGLNRMCCYVFSLELKCRFLGAKGGRRSICGCKLHRKPSPGGWSPERPDHHIIYLTPLPLTSPWGYRKSTHARVYGPTPPKYNPPYITTH